MPVGQVFLIVIGAVIVLPFVLKLAVFALGLTIGIVALGFRLAVMGGVLYLLWRGARLLIART